MNTIDIVFRCWYNNTKSEIFEVMVDVDTLEDLIIQLNIARNEYSEDFQTVELIDIRLVS